MILRLNNTILNLSLCHKIYKKDQCLYFKINGEVFHEEFCYCIKQCEEVLETIDDALAEGISYVYIKIYSDEFSVIRQVYEDNEG